ncbi:hypothetical protein [Aeromonas allosaccharophila]|uniref:hypothetical protein n=1 Tax=Aeromonas allosaccharophila TaxID=656 RepID=UPI002ADF64F1|nr:hypothetical protein [Aeromonas allosaccharophila]
MSYLSGTGNLGDPYVIHNKEALLKWVNSDFSFADKYASLIADIDLTGESVGSVAWRGSLDGNGYSIKNAVFYKQIDCYCAIKKLGIVNPDIKTSSSTLALWTGYIEDCYVTGGTPNKNILHAVNGTVRRLVSNSPSTLLGNSNNYDASCYFLPGAPSTPLSGTNLISSLTPFSPSNYPALTKEINTWIVDGGSMPRLKAQDITFLKQGYVVKGVVKVGGVAKPRFVRALSASDFFRISDGVSAANGSFMLRCGYYTDTVMVASYELYGLPPAINKGYVTGDIIHPATPNGFRYLCTKAGNSGATLPPEPWSTSAALTIGAAIFTPDPVYQPQLHGPIKPVLVDLITGQPV